MNINKESHSARFTPKIISATFLRGITGSNSILNDEVPHIAFVGRSNVGKSSSINALLGTAVARASKTPGKTQEINFFRAAVHGDRGRKFSRYVVDLPGYGYARIPVPEAEKIRKHIVWYLTSEEIHSAVLVLIIDAAVGVTDFDRELVSLAHEAGRPLVVLLNKIDKLNQKERAAATKKLHEEFPDIEYFLFSAKTGEGRAPVLESLFSFEG